MRSSRARTSALLEQFCMSPNARASKNDDDRVIRQGRKEREEREGKKTMSVARRCVFMARKRKTRCFLASTSDERNCAPGKIEYESEQRYKLFLHVCYAI